MANEGEAERPAPPTPQEIMDLLVHHDPQRHPLVIGLVAPLGTRLDPVVASLESSFAEFGYGAKSIVLSSFLDNVKDAPWGKLPSRGDANYYSERMNAGDELRRHTETSATLSALAITQIAEFRETLPESTVYILRSLKHPDEAAILSYVYGQAFWLVGVVSDVDERANHLAELLNGADDSFANARVRAQELMERDEDDSARSFGQHVRDVFGTADVYLPNREGFDATDDVERFVEGIFGKPFLTPDPAEEAMRLALDASLRSAAVGRQVGAVLVPASSASYVTGTNEVPKPGGGQFWRQDQPDHRDFQSGKDPNAAFMAKMLREFLGRLKDAHWLEEELRKLSTQELLARANAENEDGISILGGARVRSVIEFTRCLHAEQAAIVNSARQGISTEGATLFTTTFPCHECAKFIVGAGVTELVYIEAYPKSLVDALYKDLIDTRPPMVKASLEPPGELVGGKVPFRPFVGFAPSRYKDVFEAHGRKASLATGVAVFEKSKAMPVGAGWPGEAIVGREATITRAVTELLEVTFPIAQVLAPEHETGGDAAGNEAVVSEGGSEAG